ncbi:MAG: phage tail tape measure protein [Lachnospiraceae bacterium]|nr:phage tail tape measure protein [Lachnospiraceae bacterium]
MAKNKIAIVVAVDREKEFTKAITDINKSLQVTKSESAKVAAEFEGQKNTLKALTAKHEVLTKKLAEQQEKQKAATKGLEHAKEVQAAATKRLEELNKTLSDAKKKQEEMKASGSASEKELKSQAKAIEEYENAVSRQEGELGRCENKIKTWQQKLNTAEKEVVETNRAVNKNAAYMKEAEEATDGCATSIDKFGQKVKDAGEITTTLKDKIGNALVTKGTSAALDVLTDAVGAVKDAMYDVSSASANLAAKTGLSEAAAKRYQGVMKQIKGDNFGESYADVADAMSEVIQTMGELNEADVTNITESALTLRDTFGMDVNETIRAVDVMTKTMGVDASTAFDLIVTGAQNGLNRSGELTDNLIEYSSLWGQAGFSAEEMFAILENGLDSGAYNLDKVNDYVKEFGNSLADGRVEDNLDSFSEGTQNLFRQWKSGGASTSDVFYSVINDLESMENQQEALTIASETWSSLGEDNAMQVLTALNDVNDGYKNVKGSMDSLKEVKYSDLESAVSGLGSALQEKIVTPIADLALPATTGLVEGVTSGLNAIGEGTEPPKSAMQELVDSVTAANEEIEQTIGNARTMVENAGEEAGNVELLGERLLKLNGIQDKTLTQKNEMSAVVQQLSQYIPDIASAYDEESGTMSKTNEEIRAMIDNTKELMIAQASQEAMQKLISDELKAQQQLDKANKVEADLINQIGLLKEEKELIESMYSDQNMDPEVFDATMLEYWKKRLDECTISQEEYNEIIRSGLYTYDMYADRAFQVNSALEETGKAEGEAARETKRAQDALDALCAEEEDLTETTSKWMDKSSDATETVQEGCAVFKDYGKSAEKADAAVSDFGNSMSELPPSLNEAARDALGLTGRQKELSEATEDAAKAAKDQAEAAKVGAGAQKEAYQSMLDTYHSTVDDIEADLQNKINPFEKFDGGADMTVEEMLSNLQSQTDAMEKYKENLQTVTDAMGHDIAPEFLQYIQDMGLEGANMLQHMADTLEQDNGKELLKQLSDEYVEGLDKSEEIARAQAANEIALKASMGELGSSEADFTNLQDNITSAITDAIGDTDSAWNGISEDTEDALNEAVAIARECGVQIPEGLAEGIASGTVTPEEVIAQLNGSVEGSLNGLLQMAKENGMDIPENVAEGIAAGGQSAVDAYNELISLLAAAKAEAEAAGEEGGTAAADSFTSGVESGAENASSAGSAISESAATSAGKNKSDFNTAGKTAANQYASGISGSASAAVQAAGNMASRAASAVRSWQNSFYTAGYNIANSLASGISSNSSLVSNAAARAVQNARNAANQEAEKSKAVKKLLETEKGDKKGQESARAAIRDAVNDVLDTVKEGPELKAVSSRFRQGVGRQISSNMAFGIRDNASLAGREASRMSNTVYTRAVTWMQRYKQDHKTSLDEEIYYWKQVLKHTKEGTSAYYRALGNLNRVTGYQVGSRDLAEQINSNFGVSRTRRSGNQTTRLDDATYYGEIYSAAAQYMRNYQLLNDMSLQQQQAYWRNVRDNLKRGTQAWYDATSQINDLQDQIEQEQQDRFTTRANVQQSILDRYRVYYRVSARAEMEYWNAARRQFREGTDERIAADQRYFEAQQEYYDQRRELDENYAQDSQKINDQLIQDLEDLEDAYKDAVKSRKEDILSQMDLFEAWDSSGYDADTLLYNLRTQVAGLALWEQQLNELSKKKISAALLEELRQMGPEAAASIYSLNQMTAQQLEEYNRLWEQRNALAESQAVNENEGLRQETNQQILQLRSEAREELNALNAEYRSALAELNTGMGSELRNLVNQAANIGEDAVSSLIAGIGRAADSVETYQSTARVTNQLTSQLSHLSQEGRTIGTNTLNGILNGLTDYTKIESASKEVIQSIRRAMEEAADIHSPSKLFQRVIGQQIPAGVSLGIKNGTGAAAESAKSMVERLTEDAGAQMQRQQDTLEKKTALLNYSGVSRLNRMLEGYQQQAPVININNDSLASLLSTLITAVNGLSEKVDNQQLVMDTGVLVAAIQPAMSQESATIAVRRNRGRMP